MSNSKSICTVQIAKNRYNVIGPDDYENLWRMTGYEITPYALSTDKTDVSFKQKETETYRYK
jgi:hypothetical protein